MSAPPWPIPAVPANVRVDYELWELFSSVVQIEPFLSQNEYQDPTFGDPSYYRARTEMGIQEVRNVQGTESLVTGRVHMLCVDPISPKDRLTLDTGDSPPILQVDRHNDEKGVYFTTLYTGMVGFRQTSTSA
jgi:hypothetical protein